MPHRPLPKWPRQRLRIRVRGLIFLVLIIGVGLGWIAEGARIQREAVAAIRRDGGFVLYDWESKVPWVLVWNGRSYQSERKPGALQRLVDRLGVDYVGHPVSVALDEQGSPSAFRHIERLSHVAILDLHGSFVTDAGIAHLAGLTDLASLNIGDRVYNCSETFTPRGTARVTDVGMQYLKHLTKLVFLDLNGTQAGDAGLSQLAGLTRLETLQLEGTRVTDAGLVHLAEMTKLTHLELNDTAITDAGLVHLKTLIGLKGLSLRGTQITDAGLTHLEHFARFGRLDLSDTRVTDAGLGHLPQALPELHLEEKFNPGP